MTEVPKGSLAHGPQGQAPESRSHKKHFQPWDGASTIIATRKMSLGTQMLDLGGAAGLGWGRWGRWLEAWQRKYKSAS